MLPARFGLADRLGLSAWVSKSSAGEFAVREDRNPAEPIQAIVGDNSTALRPKNPDTHVYKVFDGRTVTCSMAIGLAISECLKSVFQSFFYVRLQFACCFYDIPFERRFEHPAMLLDRFLASVGQNQHLITEVFVCRGRSAATEGSSTHTPELGQGGTPSRSVSRSSRWLSSPASIFCSIRCNLWCAATRLPSQVGIAILDGQAQSVALQKHTKIGNFG